MFSKLVLLFIISNTTFLMGSGWHSWEKTPKKGQLYMQIHSMPGFPVEERQTMFLTHWDGKPIIVSDKNCGWWEMDPKSLWKLFHEGSKVVYLPSGLKSMKYLNGKFQDRDNNCH